MANLKDIKNRIGSVKKTKQITSAMKLVASAKLKRASDAATMARPYRERLGEVLANVGAAAGESYSDPLLESREDIKRILVVILTSDRGLCGGFNNNLNRRIKPWLDAKQAEGLDVEVRVYGRKGNDFLKSRFDVAEATTDWSKSDKMDLVRPLSQTMVGGFIDGQYDEVYLAYNHFESTLVQTPTFDKILPLTVEQSDASAPADFTYEPGPAPILSTLLPLYLRTLILQAFLETEAGEHAARMTAMDNATNNASDLINALSLEFNRARQAAITTEIIEIVSGAAAL